MFKYIVLCSFFVLNVLGYDLQFNGCNKDGWLCQNITKGRLNLIYSCTKEFEQKNKEVRWNYGNLPPETESVIIENCDVALTLDTNLYLSGATKSNKLEKITEILSDYLINLKTVIVRNVKEIELKQSVRDLFSRLRGHASIQFENIELIKNFPSYVIEGPSPYIQKMKMESFQFVMNNVKVQHMSYRSVFWDQESIPIYITWKNVHIEGGDRPVEIIASTSDWPQSEIEAPQNNQVHITDSIFKTISHKFFSMQNTYFDFINNEVDIFEPFGFESRSVHHNISGNTFNTLKSNAFGWVYYGKEEKNFIFHSNKINYSQLRSLSFNDLDRTLGYIQRVSFKDNKFNCSNAEWMKRSTNRTENAITLKVSESDYKVLTDTEDIFYNSSDNICLDFGCFVTINQYRLYFLQYNKVPTKCSCGLY